MYQNPASHRGTHSIPVHTNLLNVRRKQPRCTFTEADARSPAGYWGCGDRPRLQAVMSSTGEDRALLLGFTLMGFAVLMYFLFGFAIVRPYLCSFSNWKEGSNCTLIRAEIQPDWVDCKEQGSYPCLEVIVNLSLAECPAILQHNEDPILLATKCFYLPKCQCNKKEALKLAEKIQENLQEMGDSPFPCHGGAEKEPNRAILSRKYNRRLVVRYMLWATLVLALGTGIVCLLRLNQYLSRWCEELKAQAGGRERPLPT